MLYASSCIRRNCAEFSDCFTKRPLEAKLHVLPCWRADIRQSCIVIMMSVFTHNTAEHVRYCYKGELWCNSHLVERQWAKHSDLPCSCTKQMAGCYNNNVTSPPLLIWNRTLISWLFIPASLAQPSSTVWKKCKVQRLIKVATIMTEWIFPWQ